jgi:hypothetical protein
MKKKKKKKKKKTKKKKKKKKKKKAATDTHTEFVTLIALLQQQWLSERVSILRLHLHCLSYLRQRVSKWRM